MLSGGGDARSLMSNRALTNAVLSSGSIRDWVRQGALRFREAVSDSPDGNVELRCCLKGCALGLKCPISWPETRDFVRRQTSAGGVHQQ